MNILTDEEAYEIGQAHQLSSAVVQAIAEAVLRTVDANKLAQGVSVEPVGYAYAHQDYIGSVIGAKGEWAPNEVPLYTADQLTTAIAAARVQALEDAATLIESTELSGLNNDIQLQVFVGKMLIGYCKAIRALIGGSK